MTERARPLVAGNWKMNGLRKSLDSVEAICSAVEAGGAGRAEIVLCPPATLVMAAAQGCEGRGVLIGGQDCHSEPSGAFTGDISALMLKDSGAAYVILGHSERRSFHHETNEDVRAKAAAALREGLTPIICIGETREERDAGRAREIVESQLAGSVPAESVTSDLVIAYEPIWAIGSGVTPAPPEIAEIHGFIRAWLEAHLPRGGAGARILYGGSVKPANAADLLRAEHVDGALVGGASLVPADFLAIASVYR
jgi:triosephosphate isomerase